MQRRDTRLRRANTPDGLMVRLVWEEPSRDVNELVPPKPSGEGGVHVLLFAAVLLVSATANAADLRITDSRGTEVVVQSAAIDYGGFMGSEKGTEGIRLMQGDGSVMVKWTTASRQTPGA